MDKLQKIIDECSEQAQELIDFGNSKEQAEGYGMKRVINEIIQYKQINSLIFSEFDMAMAMGYACAIDNKLPTEVMKKDSLDYIENLKKVKNGG